MEAPFFCVRGPGRGAYSGLPPGGRVGATAVAGAGRVGQGLAGGGGAHLLLGLVDDAVHLLDEGGHLVRGLEDGDGVHRQDNLLVEGVDLRAQLLGVDALQGGQRGGLFLVAGVGLLEGGVGLHQGVHFVVHAQGGGVGGAVAGGQDGDHAVNLRRLLLVGVRADALVGGEQLAQLVGGVGLLGDDGGGVGVGQVHDDAHGAVALAVGGADVDGARHGGLPVDDAAFFFNLLCIERGVVFHAERGGGGLDDGVVHVDVELVVGAEGHVRRG